MTDKEVVALAEAAALRRIAQRAEEFREALEEQFREALPGNHTASEALLLAQLMTSRDGYKDVEYVPDWEKRPLTGWVTSLAFLPMLGLRVWVPFAIEVRQGDHTRKLAITIDDNRPGERLPEKIRRDNALISLDFRVISLTELEIMSNADECRERVENVLAEMADDVLKDAGIAH